MEIRRLYMLQYHNLPSGGSSDLIIVILSQDLEQLVEEHWQESDDHWDPLHAEKTLEKDEKDEWRRTRRGRRVERTSKKEAEGRGKIHQKEESGSNAVWQLQDCSAEALVFIPVSVIENGFRAFSDLQAVEEVGGRR